MTDTQTRTVSGFEDVLTKDAALAEAAVVALKSVPAAIRAKEARDTASIAGRNVWYNARFNVSLQNILMRMGCTWRDGDDVAIAGTTALMVLFLRS